MRVSANTEHRAMATTMISTLIGRRSAARISHIANSLLSASHRESLGMGRDGLGLARSRASCAKRSAAPGRLQSGPSPVSFVIPPHQKLFPVPLYSARQIAFPCRRSEEHTSEL